MKIAIIVSALVFSNNLFAQDLLNWQPLESDYTLASRLLNYDQQQTEGDYLSESTFRAYHNYQDLVLAWRLDNQIYQANDNHNLNTEWQFELTELSWSHSFLESGEDLWQIGKFNLPLDPGYALQSVAFFESSTDPFDDFASNEGLTMINASIWLQDYYLSTVISLEGQNSIYQDNSQWALIMQRDFAALSSSVIVQQYQKSNLGIGSTFTYVSGDSWEFHGSTFIRKGSLWLTELSNNSTLEDSFSERDNVWLPSVVLGSVWSGLENQFLMEWSYQKEKLSETEINTLQKISAMAPAIEYNPQSANAFAYQKAIIDLYHQRYQQQYLFVQYQYQFLDHTITANSLIGLDKSAVSQLKYEYLYGDSIAYWLTLDMTSGSEQTEFRQIPWQNRLQVGLQWKI